MSTLVSAHTLGEAALPACSKADKPNPLCLAPPKSSLGEPKSCRPLGQRATFGVCGWLANRHYSHQILGGRPQPVAALGCWSGDGSPPPEGSMQRRRAVSWPEYSPRRNAPWETQWGQLNGHEMPFASCAVGSYGRVHSRECSPILVTKSTPLVGGSRGVTP
jgi:hypothetical protein